MRVVLHLGIRVAPERRQELIAFLVSARSYYEAPGGIRVALLERRDASGEFIEVVEYESETAYATDQRRVEEDPQMQALLRHWRSLLEGPPVVVVYTDLLGIPDECQGLSGQPSQPALDTIEDDESMPPRKHGS